MAERQTPPVSNPLKSTHTATLQPAVPEDAPSKDPVFLVMFTGQIEFAEASPLLSCHCLVHPVSTLAATNEMLDSLVGINISFSLISFQNLMISTVTTAMCMARIGKLCL